MSRPRLSRHLRPIRVSTTSRSSRKMGRSSSSSSRMAVPAARRPKHFFNVLFYSFGKHAHFFGVFDGSVSKAKKWATQYQAQFPLVSDPDLRIVHEYKAENSAYVAVIAKGGTIEKLWPGYSVEMLADMAAHLARLTGVAESQSTSLMHPRR